jgi:hypothetical protein
VKGLAVLTVVTLFAVPTAGSSRRGACAASERCAWVIREIGRIRG